MFVINLLLNKILCAAFGTLPSGPPPSYPSMSHLNYVKNLGSSWDPLPPFWTMSHISILFIYFFKASLTNVLAGICWNIVLTKIDLLEECSIMI